MLAYSRQVKALADSVELEYRAGPGFSSTDRRDSSGVLKIICCLFEIMIVTRCDCMLFSYAKQHYNKLWYLIVICTNYMVYCSIIYNMHRQWSYDDHKMMLDVNVTCHQAGPHLRISQSLQLTFGSRAWMVCGGKLVPKSMRVESPYRKYRIGQTFGIRLEHMARRSKVCTCTVNIYKSFYIICNHL